MRSADDVLMSLLSLLERDIQKMTIDIWFSDSKAVELRQDCFIIRTSTAYKKEIILSRYGDMVKKTLSEMFSAEMDFVVLDNEEDAPSSSASEHGFSDAVPEQKFTFDDFVVGASNRFDRKNPNTGIVFSYLQHSF